MKRITGWVLLSLGVLLASYAIIDLPRALNHNQFPLPAFLVSAAFIYAGRKLTKEKS
jgi:hypothetical protein